MVCRGIYASAMPQGQRIVSKSDLLVLHRPQHSRRPLIYVRVTVDRGLLTIEKCSRRCSFRPSSVNGEYDMKLVWVTNNCDVLDGNVRYSFEVITPEKSYILKAESHRAKIDWMQTLSISSSQCLQFRGSYRPASWSNLEDLQLWLTVREVQYVFCDMEEFKGAIYTGKWQIGKPHGLGSMEWPDGHRYGGEFVKGKIEGIGTMIWLSDPTTATHTGSWMNGKAEGHGETRYRDGSMYRGWWRVGIRWGHGQMEYKDPESLYIGGWERDKREGYGVFHNTASGEHYLGMWKNNRRNGLGILINGDDVLYSGVFRDGERVERIADYQFQHDNKWSALFQGCAEQLQQMVTSSHSNPNISHKVSDDLYGLGGDYRFGDDRNPNNPNECLVCRMEGFGSADHPFGMLINHFTRCFNGSYSAIVQHPTLLPHAIGELTSVTSRLHKLVWRLCPTVIQHNRASVQDSRTHSPRGGPAINSEGSGNVGLAGDHTWLYPILLPSITDTLMALYRAHYSMEDEKLSSTLRDLDEREDDDLCELLELMSEHSKWKEGQQGKTFIELFHPASEIFSKIGECRTSLNKLLCVQETNAEVTRIYRHLHPERDSLLAYSHDQQGQLTSSRLFSYVIVRSQQNVSCLSSEIQFISDFAGSVLRTEEYGYLLTELKGCYQQLIELYVNEDEWI